MSFALGNKLLGILDGKQHREREGDKNIGWYHKTDFVIKAVIGGEEFNYEGRFDIGDGEGDLIAHIKNFYDYALSPKGEQLYGDDRESLLRGRDEFIPFLEQHTELTQEDEKLLDEIMATESDWYRTAEEAEEKPQAYADIMNGSEAPAIEMEQSADDLIGREIIIDNRKYLIENIGKISGDVSLRDITFQNNVGFPINRVEKIGYIQKLLEQEKTELPSEEKTEAPAVPVTDRHNFRITDDAIGIGGAKEKFRNNMVAINLLHELEIENRLATPEEQEVLSRYVGWGGLSMAFDEHNAAWAEEFKELYASLSPEEYRAAMESTLTAFYTPPVVIKAMYGALDRLGFSQGNILEPSCGTGNFFGLLPESMQNSKLHGVEIDSLTGRIAKQLYQKANIAIEGFEKTNLPDDHFDVVLGNVPFGEIRVNDSRYNAQKFLIHDYFFAKALDKVRAGGVVMFITSKGTMDKASPEVRKYIAQRAELLGAIRLPDNTFKAKEEMTNIILTDPNADIIIIDPEREYSPLVKAMQGEVIHISATSENHINAMDMNSDYGDGANPVILKSEFILSLCEQLIGGASLGAKQKSIIDRCTASVYRHYQQGNYMGTPPTLQDFREELLKQNEPEAQEIALAIELFTDGSLNTFAKHTNVDTHSRLICYDILDLGKQLQPIGMLVVLDSILNRITQNRAKGRNTFIFIDEIYLLFQHEYSANFLFTLWKRVRKYGAYCTGITQNVDDLLQSHTARTMLANSEFIIMLNQESTDRLELAKLLNISDLQMSYITNVGAGQGLLKVGSSLVPFVNKFPRNTELYKLMTTKFGEV